MTDGIDIQFVRETYQKMTDDELVRVATQDAAGLTLAAQEVVREEIEKRGLASGIIKGVEAQNKTYTIEEIDRYCEIVRDLECPVCGSTDSKLNGTLTSEVMSFIIITQYSKKLKIACPDCLDKANNDALTKTAVLGWWGIPWGIVRTIQAIGLNVKSKKTNRVEEPNDYMRSFVLGRVGELETYKDSRGKLREIISAK
jgi:hypothetical protein